MAYDYKQDFPLLRAMDVAYVDNAATAQRPQCVLDAENDFYCRHNANPLRGLYPLSVEATDAYENAREAVRDFLGAASTQEIIFTRNTTESLNLVAYSYGLSHIKTGDEVVVSIMEHHSNLLPWQMVCRQTGATLKFMECERDGSLDLHKVEQLITERTKLVALTQVSNVLGRQYPVREIAAMAHKKGAVIVVDGARALCLALSFFLGPATGERVTAAVSLACSLALCALGLKLSLGLHSGWLFAFAAFGLLWGTLRQLGLARGAKSV